MAWALQLNGTNQYLRSELFYLPTNCDIDLEIAWNALGGNYEMVIGTWEGASNNGTWYFGKLNPTNGTLTLYNRANGARNNSAAGTIVVGEYATYTVERRGNDLRVLKDGVEVIAPLTFTAGHLDTYQIQDLFKANVTNQYHCDISFKSGKVTDIDTGDIYHWDATASDHSNTGSQPEVTDIVGTNDLTGFNFPTDGSAWVDLGGGALQIDPSLVDNSGNVSVFTPDSVSAELVLDIPLVTSSPIVYNPDVLREEVLEPSIVSTTPIVEQPSVLLAKVLEVPNVENTDSEVYALTVSLPKIIDVTNITQANAQVFNLFVLDGNGIPIPVTSRDTILKVANHLREQGFTGSNNDVIIDWLFTEGIEKTDYNTMFVKYLESQGYTEGAFNDKYKLWVKGS
jgi:hypothetical protein